MDLVSGIPRQETETLMEKMVIPLIHFILLGFLPLGGLRRSRNPAYAAGCGQLLMARRTGYEAAGGHAAIAASLHDGITLPRAFRTAGLRTDLCDLTEVATCRMYRNAAQVWSCWRVNATRGAGGSVHDRSSFHHSFWRPGASPVPSCHNCLAAAIGRGACRACRNDLLLSTFRCSKTV